MEHDLVRAMVQHCRLTLAKVARPLGLGDTVTELDWLISRVVSAPVDTTVRTELMRRAWPQQRLVALAGLHQSTVSRALRGSSPQPEMIDRMADALGMSREELVVAV